MTFLNRYKVSDFTATKDQLFIQRTKDIESVMIRLLNDWRDYACSKQGIDQSESPAWDRYAFVYCKKVIESSRDWPLYLPAGYVFYCFIQSTELEILTLADHKESFEVFIKSGTVREDMYSAFNEKKFYKHPGSVSNEVFSEMEQAAESLYGDVKIPEQKKLFD